jgi:flagellar hook-associated protein FlgK
MSLEVTLRNAISGLGVTQKNIEIVSRNSSNVQTEGYTRKIHQQQQLDPRVGGVTSLDAVRVVDDALRDRRADAGDRLQLVDRRGVGIDRGPCRPDGHQQR